MSDMNIDTLDAAELKKQLNALEVEYNPKANAETLRKKLKEALGSNEEEDELPKNEHKNSYVEIKFDKDEKNKQPVYFGLNGRSYRFLRGVWARCPRILLPTIENTKKDVWDEEEKKLDSIQPYPYQVREVR